jgi:16S rRNA (cytidine1402-2'-O)-methyltransferase
MNWLRTVCATEHVFSFFEAPHRIDATLREAGPYLGDRPIMVAREITKVHQEFIRGTASQLSQRLTAPRGEFTVIVGPPVKTLDKHGLSVTDDEVVREFWRLTESGEASRREAVRLVAQGSGRSSRDVYAVIERAKKLV